MHGRTLRVVRLMAQPLPALDGVAQAVTAAATLIFGGTVLGVTVSPWTGLAVVLLALLMLAFRAAYLLQRRFDLQPELGLRLDPERASGEAFIEDMSHGPKGHYYYVIAEVVNGAPGVHCGARIVAIERRTAAGFAKYPPFGGAIELGWPRHPLQHVIDIESDVPERLVVAIGVDDKVFLGTDTGSLGDALEIPHGEYRVQVRVRPEDSSDGAVRTERWFRVKHDGSPDEVELRGDQP